MLGDEWPSWRSTLVWRRSWTVRGVWASTHFINMTLTSLSLFIAKAKAVKKVAPKKKVAKKVKKVVAKKAKGSKKAARKSAGKKKR